VLPGCSHQLCYIRLDRKNWSIMNESAETFRDVLTAEREHFCMLLDDCRCRCYVV